MVYSCLEHIFRRRERFFDDQVDLHIDPLKSGTGVDDDIHNIPYFKYFEDEATDILVLKKCNLAFRDSARFQYTVLYVSERIAFKKVVQI